MCRFRFFFVRKSGFCQISDPSTSSKQVLLSNPKTNLGDFIPDPTVRPRHLWSWYIIQTHHFKGQTQAFRFTLGCKTQVNILDCHYIKELKPLGFEAIFFSSFSFIAMYSCQCVLLNKRKYCQYILKIPSIPSKWVIFFHLMFFWATLFVE